MPLVVTAVAHQHEDYGLEPEELVLLWRMEERHFWHRARNRWIAAALRRAGVRPPATVLEVGCGSGAVSTFLHETGYRVTGVDTSLPQVRKAYERCPDASFIVGSIESLTPPAERYDAVCFFDVLEHLDDPLAMLAAAGSHARPGTLFVATVPAQRALHSAIDDLSGHKKRYERGELAELFRTAGLDQIEERGIFRAILPMLRRVRRDARDRDVAQLTPAERHHLWVDNFRVPSLPVNSALTALCAMERLGFAGARDREGASLLATGRLPS
jgi:SAM-dependent methyltransferase